MDYTRPLVEISHLTKVYGNSTLGLLLLLVFTGICIGMYYLCNHIMKHKKNLE